RLRRLADNPRTELVVFRSAGAKWTWSQVDEMHNAISRLHRAGKRTAWYGASVGTRGYAVAALCGKIGMPEAGSVQVQGIGVDFVGLADALTLVGARVDAIRFEKHKSAPESFTRRRISKELKATYRRIIGARWNHFMKIVSKGRQLSAERVERVLRDGAVAPQAAKAAALIDAVAEPVVFEKLLRKWNWLAADASLQPLRPQMHRRTRWGARPRIAVIVVDGMIVDGRTSKGLSGAQTGGAQTARLLSSLGAAPNVAGVILRLNTGGGAVWGSDAMFHAAKGLSRRKPIVASMASMAASGGYWTALGADLIFANPSTITGSIGIWIAKPDLSGALRRLQVGVDRVSTGPWPFVNSLKSGWSPAEQGMIRRSLKRYYDLFLARVAKRRSLSLSALGPLAGGRLWLGDSARRHQLVDRTGGFMDAMDYLTGRMNLVQTPQIDFFPKLSFSERVRSLLFGVVSSQIKQIRSLVGPWLDQVAVLAALPKAQPLAIAPIQIESPKP
ncbi:MAG TPA: hypothetical protein DCQ06_14895, partial [Myxococcales bacterium]|nr:hypothetical protein [Myxococcales bacterium]